MEPISLEQQVLNCLKDTPVIDSSFELAEKLNVTHTDLDSVLKSLASAEYISLKKHDQKVINLTEEGKAYAENGTPEFQYASALEEGKQIPKTEL